MSQSVRTKVRSQAKGQKRKDHLTRLAATADRIFRANLEEKMAQLKQQYGTELVSR